MRVGSRMNDAEPLIMEYDLKNWQNPLYASDRDVEKRCHPLTLSDKYRGIYRLIPQQGSDDDLEQIGHDIYQQED